MATLATDATDVTDELLVINYMQLLFDQLVKQSTNLKILAATAVASLLATATLNTTPVREANLSSTSREAEQASQVGLLLSAAAIVGLGVGALQANKSTNKTGASYSRSQQQQQDRNIITIDQVSSKLRTQLLTLLHRDIQGINRLLNQAKFKYPNRTNNWYAEKVIYDLTRDRGA
ncbi:hypothetical protein DSM106972_063420 [Dulcicalothrix desertica PCC 7102]|uniref:Uncharacterized protein n=1 Tax=Dulcicalothrix desertica PCC 7102 TaxID=232991 RepID=A0A433V6N9_9CYAN|nr:hypothetical protein [Dulcicalothrix desertica]RUT01719.1 hypothetical protein DSM106972_063420 [Dulcicalothrix desertica PCC 7102]TWH42870.1 hypothetical protein CAL7102_06553 [Dulcicalothrix desertica PCC 7102]